MRDKMYKVMVDDLLYAIEHLSECDSEVFFSLRRMYLTELCAKLSLAYGLDLMTGEEFVNECEGVRNAVYELVEGVLE